MNAFQTICDINMLVQTYKWSYIKVGSEPTVFLQSPKQIQELYSMTSAYMCVFMIPDF